MKRLWEAISRARSIAVITHAAPDGDALGSALAFARGLRALGKTASAYCADPVPKLYAFSPDASLLLPPEAAPEKIDLCVMVDVADPVRTDGCGALWGRADARAVIDHHLICAPPEGASCWIDPSFSSCGEMVLRMLDELNAPLDKDTATLLYIAVSTDTGQFSYSSVTSGTYHAAARLAGAGVDVSNVTYMLYRRRRREKTLLTARALSSLVFGCEGRVACMALSRDDFLATGASEEDCEGIVNYGIEIEGVDAAFLARERGEDVKCGVRVKTGLDAAAICRKFGGGGHGLAAGCTMRAPLPDACKAMIDALCAAIREVRR